MKNSIWGNMKNSIWGNENITILKHPISRRAFIKYLTFASLSILLLWGIKEWIAFFKKEKLKEQVLSKRIIWIPQNILIQIFGEDEILKKWIIFHNNIARVDTHHLWRIDQWYDIWQQVKTLTDSNIKEINISLQDQWQSHYKVPWLAPHKKTYHNMVEYHIIKKAKNIDKKILQQLFFDITLRLHNLTEQQQGEDFIIKTGSITAGVITDTNANIINSLLAIQDEIIQEIYQQQWYDTKYWCTVNFKDLEIIKWIFNDHILQGRKAWNKILQDNIWEKLTKSHRVKTSPLWNNYPWLEIKEKITIQKN